MVTRYTGDDRPLQKDCTTCGHESGLMVTRYTGDDRPLQKDCTTCGHANLSLLVQTVGGCLLVEFVQIKSPIRITDTSPNGVSTCVVT